MWFAQASQAPALRLATAIPYPHMASVACIAYLLSAFCIILAKYGNSIRTIAASDNRNCRLWQCTPPSVYNTPKMLMKILGTGFALLMFERFEPVRFSVEGVISAIAVS